MGDMDAYRDVFMSETAEFIQGITDGLLALEQNPSDGEPLEVIFRGAHSLKGMSAAMGYDRTAELTHKMESLADRVRKGELAVNPSLIDLMLDAVDTLKALVDDEAAGTTAVDASEVTSRLEAAASAQADLASATDAAGEQRGYRVVATLENDCVLKAVRAYMVIKRLTHLGEVLDTVPSAREIEDEHFDRTFSVIVRTGADTEEIAKAVLAVSEVEHADVFPEAIPELVPDTQQDDGSGAGPASTRPSIPKLSEAQTVRIAIGHLDNLVNLVGELVILRARLEGMAPGLDSRELDESLEDLRRVSAELQHEVMHTRMVPVDNVFNRFPRMVRDLARDLGKDVVLETDGLEIELDRTVLDEIGDPLVHLLRNSIDHGIEAPDLRERAGKPPQGTVRLSAARDRDLVRITVSDDGGGIDADVVWRKACEQGLVDDASRDSYRPEDIVMLTCTPGFSTIDHATRVSGRGVGMDAVKGKIEYLGGSMKIETTPGQGTEVTLLLPLTLAIIQALMIELGGRVFAVPLGSVMEVMNPADARLDTVDGATVLVLDGGPVVPVFRLDVLFELRPGDGCEAPAPDERLLLLVDGSGQRKALVVHRLLGRREIVVKPLSGLLSDVRGLSGATVLGDGSVALILDPRTVFPSREEV
jgi:two-component system chemotaxis sensor kinase CheA